MESYKSLLIVMLVAMATFKFIRPVFLAFMSDNAFDVRRNAWFGVTLAAFLIGNYWIYLLVATLVISYFRRKESNPTALYAMLLIAAPPERVTVPGVGAINMLFLIDHYRFLSLVLLAPIGYRIFTSRSRQDSMRAIKLFDAIIFLYVGLQVVLSFPYFSPTDVVRRAFIYCLEIVLPYYVFSRAVSSKESITEVLASLALATAIHVPLAIYEQKMTWFLYMGIGAHWGVPTQFPFVFRGDNLRVTTSMGNSIVLSYVMAVGFGCWLYLRSHVTNRTWSFAGVGAFVAGMAVTFARGPWVAAVGGLFVFLAVQPKGSSKLVKTIVIAGLIGGAVLVTPIGEKIIDYLPFVGSAGDSNETVEYRKRLMEVSWALFKQNLIFGTPFYLDYMEEMRQGQGIVDMVNAYAEIGLSSGVVGLSLFVAFFVGMAWKSFFLIRSSFTRDPDFSALGASLVACLAITLIVLATTSYCYVIPYYTWFISGLLCSYIRLGVSQPLVNRVQAKEGLLVNAGASKKGRAGRYSHQAK